MRALLTLMAFITCSVQHDADWQFQDNQEASGYIIEYGRQIYFLSDTVRSAVKTEDMLYDLLSRSTGGAIPAKYYNEDVEMNRYWCIDTIFLSNTPTHWNESLRQVLISNVRVSTKYLGGANDQLQKQEATLKEVLIPVRDTMLPLPYVTPNHVFKEVQCFEEYW